MDAAGRLGQTGEASTSASDVSTEGRPLLKLIKILFRIIDNEEKTVLTNSQLIDILQKEFQIDVTSKTELEVDIYMNILKKFLKSWPRWDEFDKMIKYSKADPGKNVEAILTTECENLKTYLKKIFTLSEGQMAPILEKLEKTKIKERTKVKERKESKEKDCGEVVMEITCSRSQLNKLIFKHPHGGTIFNITENRGPTKICLTTFSLIEILNWPQIAVTISLPWIEAVRTNSSHISRMLRNLKLQEPESSKEKELSEEIYWRLIHGHKRMVNKSTLMILFGKLIDVISMEHTKSKKQNNILDILTEFKHNLTRTPPTIILNAEYQYFLNRIPYVRYLSVYPPPDTIPNDTNVSAYDLKLEETISPAVTIQFTKFKIPESTLDSYVFKTSDIHSLLDTKSDWLKIECLLCYVKFDGFLAMYHLQQHFQDHHSSEADWCCRRCLKVFPMTLLARIRWHHICTDYM